MYKVTKRDCPMFGIGPYVCEFICDTASDITTLPTSISEGTGGRTAYDNQKCASGSIAIVASGSESKQYMLNNQDIWCPYSAAVGNSGGGGSSESSITVDFTLSGASENPVANKAIVAALADKANTTHTHSANEIGADVSGSAASALEEAKAYTDSEIGQAVGTLESALADKANASDIPDLTPYAKKTEVPNIKVNSAVNADTVGGFAANEIATNPNLLINPDFKVNQRGLTTYSGNNVYGVDKWRCMNQAYMTVVDNGLKVGLVEGTTSTGLSNIIQHIDDYAGLGGKTCTISANVSELAAVGGQVKIRVNDSRGVAKYPANIRIKSEGVSSVTFTVPEGITLFQVWLYGADMRVSGETADNYTVFEWVKLEIGSLATAFVPPKSAIELLKIQAMESNVFTSTNKPYITGSSTVAANSDVCVTNHGFTPSAVIWWDGNSSGVAVSFSSTQFVMNFMYTTKRTVNYLIFK